MHAHDLAESLLSFSACGQFSCPSPGFLSLTRPPLPLRRGHKFGDAPLLLERSQLLGHGVESHPDDGTKNGATNTGNSGRTNLGQCRSRILCSTLFRPEFFNEIETTLFALVHHVLYSTAAQQALEQQDGSFHLVAALLRCGLRSRWTLNWLRIAIVGEHRLPCLVLRRLGLLGKPQRSVCLVECVTQLLSSSGLEAHRLALLWFADGYLECRARERLFKIKDALIRLKLHRLRIVLVGKLVCCKRAAMARKRCIHLGAMVRILADDIALLLGIKLCDLSRFGELAQRLDSAALDDGNLCVLLSQFGLPQALDTLLPR
mmetsp:Transcript_8794/g.24473  ORF Transcript_8794/g.24473 Transcript_8794/m.24473 type:complete len:318 (+) Transcript_8794:671-1624(+)